MTASKATLLKIIRDRNIPLPPDLMGPTAKQLQAIIRDHDAKPKQVRKSPTIDLDQDPTPDEPKRKRAPKSSANVVAINTARKPAMHREPKPAAAFRPTAPGSKRDLMARLVLRADGATIEDLMGVTGWSRSTTGSAIAYDLVSQMGLGMCRDGDRYIGSLPAGISSHVREQAQTRMAANASPDPKPTVYPYDPNERGEDKLLTRNACMARAEIWTIKNQKHGTPETGDISHDGKSVLSTLTDLHTLTINRKTGGVRLSKPVQV